MRLANPISASPRCPQVPHRPFLQTATSSLSAQVENTAITPVPKGDLSITIPRHAVTSYLHRPAIDLGRNLEVFPVEVWLLLSELLHAHLVRTSLECTLLRSWSSFHSRSGMSCSCERINKMRLYKVASRNGHAKNKRTQVYFFFLKASLLRPSGVLSVICG